MRFVAGLAAILAIVAYTSAQGAGASIGLTIRFERPEKPRFPEPEAERCRAFVERSKLVPRELRIACDDPVKAPLLLDPLAPPPEPVVRP